MLDVRGSTEPALPSNYKFGWFVSAASAIAALYFTWSGKPVAGLSFCIVAAGSLAITLISPNLLAPLNRFWFNIGLLLGRVVSPLTLGILFFVLLTPVGLITRLYGRDELRLRQKSLRTYWVRRAEQPSPNSFQNQY
jgi:hypothetical protein